MRGTWAAMFTARADICVIVLNTGDEDIVQDTTPG
jgi:hypothetical protein